MTRDDVERAAEKFDRENDLLFEQALTVRSRAAKAQTEITYLKIP